MSLKGGKMSIFISLIVGAAVGWLICYAVDMACGLPRMLGVCILGALLGGTVIPALLSISGFWTALIGSAIGVAILVWLHWKFTSDPNSYRQA